MAGGTALRSRPMESVAPLGEPASKQLSLFKWQCPQSGRERINTAKIPPQ